MKKIKKVINDIFKLTDEELVMLSASVEKELRRRIESNDNEKPKSRKVGYLVKKEE